MRRLILIIFVSCFTASASTPDPSLQNMNLQKQTKAAVAKAKIETLAGLKKLYQQEGLAGLVEKTKLQNKRGAVEELLNLIGIEDPKSRQEKIVGAISQLPDDAPFDGIVNLMRGISALKQHEVILTMGDLRARYHAKGVRLWKSLPSVGDDKADDLRALFRAEAAKRSHEDLEIYDLPLSERAIDALSAMGYRSLSQILSVYKKQRMKGFDNIPNFGRRCLAEVDSLILEMQNPREVRSKQIGDVHVNDELKYEPALHSMSNAGIRNVGDYIDALELRGRDYLLELPGVTDRFIADFNRYVHFLYFAQHSHDCRRILSGDLDALTARPYL